jgi:hypothetical protein
MFIYYRCTFQFTDDKYKDTPASNIFVRDTANSGKDKSLQWATEQFKSKTIAAGFGHANFKSEIFEVSPEEVEEYRQHQNQRSTRSMN